MLVHSYNSGVIFQRPIEKSELILCVQCLSRVVASTSLSFVSMGHEKACAFRVNCESFVYKASDYGTHNGLFTALEVTCLNECFPIICFLSTVCDFFMNLQHGDHHKQRCLLMLGRR